jgi:transposase
MLLKDVADIILYDESAIRRWIRAFIQFDYEGLIDREGRGAKPRLPCELEEVFKVELDILHDEKNGGRITVDDIQQMLIDKFDCNYSRSGIYTLLDRLNNLSSA